MQITGLSSYKTTNYNKAAKQTSFCGLTQVLERQVYTMPYEQAQQLIGLYKKPDLFVGYFPKDVLTVMKKSADSAQGLREKVKIFSNALSRIAQNVQSAEKSIFKRIDNFDMDDYICRGLLQYADQPITSSVGWVCPKTRLFLTPKEIEQAADIPLFEKTMKTIGIIPQDGKARVDYIGQGTHKKCFKLSFCDEKDEPIIHSKALVVEQNPNAGQEYNYYFMEKLGNYLEEIGFEGFQKRVKMRLSTDFYVGVDRWQKIQERMMPFYRGKYRTEKIYNGRGEFFSDVLRTNGIFPEANAALTIKKDLGKDIKQSDVVTPYIFDLKNKCGLFEFADEHLEPIKKNYDFQGHGLVWLDERNANYSCGRIIDFGCIVPYNAVTLL